VPGSSIDHIVSVTILVAALFVAMMTYNGLFATAIDYSRSRQVANKAVDLINTICLSPGDPSDWGQTNDPLISFGLQDPRTGGYTLSPYAVMRLRSSNNLVYYDGTELYYNNISANFGNNVLLLASDCVNYTEVSEVLGLNESYGFRIDINPTLDIRIEEENRNPLQLKIEVYGLGMPLSGVTLYCNLFHIDNGPTVDPRNVTTQTDSLGSAIVSFDLQDPNPSYSFTVYATLNGLSGVGYYTHNEAGELPYVIPLIQDFDSGEVIIAHNYDITGDNRVHAAVHCEEVVFFILTQDLRLQHYLVNFDGGLLNYGSKEYFTTHVPVSEVGLLIVPFKANGKLGSVILPWGLGALGVSASFGLEMGSEGYDFVATEVRQVKIAGISYQVKVSVWSLDG